MRYKWLMLWLLLCLLPAESFAAEKLIFAMDLIRHGDRTPVTKLNNVDYEWKEGFGQLTATGMRQEFELGQSLRNRYINETHLLPQQYETGTLYVRSTDYDRTLMSAESFLRGLYPEGPGPQRFQPIPIHTAPADVDNIILERVNPDVLNRAMEKYVYTTAEWKQKEAELKPYFQHWSEATGTRINALTDYDLTIGDALYIHRLYQAPMPAGLTEEDINLMIATSNWMTVMEHKARPIASLYSQKLMNHIVETLQKNGKSGAHLKYALLSAHDSTIASILSLLGAPVTSNPPYASDLNFSLYESGSNNYVVRVTYNGTPVIIPACGSHECSLIQFKAAAEGRMRASG